MSRRAETSPTPGQQLSIKPASSRSTTIRNHLQNLKFTTPPPLTELESKSHQLDTLWNRDRDETGLRKEIWNLLSASAAPPFTDVSSTVRVLIDLYLDPKKTWQDQKGSDQRIIVDWIYCIYPNARYCAKDSIPRFMVQLKMKDQESYRRQLRQKKLTTKFSRKGKGIPSNFLKSNAARRKSKAAAEPEVVGIAASDLAEDLALEANGLEREMEKEKESESDEIVELKRREEIRLGKRKAVELEVDLDEEISSSLENPSSLDSSSDLDGDEIVTVESTSMEIPLDSTFPNSNPSNRSPRTIPPISRVTPHSSPPINAMQSTRPLPNIPKRPFHSRKINNNGPIRLKVSEIILAAIMSTSQKQATEVTITKYFKSNFSNDFRFHFGDSWEQSMKSTLEDEECFEIVKTGRRTGSRKKKKQLFYWRIDKEADLSHFRDESGETYGDRREIVSDESPSWELLISEAILSTDDKKMNLEEISQYIKDNCSYFRKEEFGMVIDLVEVMVHNYCDEEIINSLEYYRLKEKVESGNRVIPSLEEIEFLSAECTSSEEEEEEEDDY